MSLTLEAAAKLKTTRLRMLRVYQENSEVRQVVAQAGGVVGDAAVFPAAVIVPASLSI